MSLHLKMFFCNYFIHDFSTPSDVSNDMRSVRFAPSETSDDINPVSLPRPKHRMAWNWWNLPRPKHRTAWIRWSLPVRNIGRTKWADECNVVVFFGRWILNYFNLVFIQQSFKPHFGKSGFLYLVCSRVDGIIKGGTEISFFEICFVENCPF